MRKKSVIANKLKFGFNFENNLTMMKKKLEKKKALEPIEMTRHLELHELMINSMKKSIRKVKKKAHKLEISMHLQPDDPQDLHYWDKNFNEMLGSNQPSNFPTLRELDKEQEKKFPPPVR